MSRSRDIADFLGKTEITNTANNALLNTASSIDAGSGGVTTYSTVDDLPTSGLTAGDQAFVTGVSRLYFSNGTGWYSQSIINANPRWADSVGSGFGEPNGTLTIVDSATPLIVRAVGVDSDALPLTTSVTLSDSAQYVFDMSQDSSVFTFTPKTKAQADAASVAGLIDSNSADINVTFKVTDGISILSKPSIITYRWLGAPAWANSDSDPYIAVQNSLNASMTLFAFPANSTPAGNWQYSEDGPGGSWSTMPSGSFFTVLGGVFWNGTTYNGYYRSTSWTTGNTSYEIRHTSITSPTWTNETTAYANDAGNYVIAGLL
jgi:hypothetical protein